MAQHDPTQVARMLIDRHGLRAGAVASEHVHEAETAGETAQLDHWRSVQAAVMELKHTERQGTARSVM
jgi:hypothetical protein